MSYINSLYIIPINYNVTSWRVWQRESGPLWPGDGNTLICPRLLLCSGLGSCWTPPVSPQTLIFSLQTTTLTTSSHPDCMCTTLGAHWSSQSARKMKKKKKMVQKTRSTRPFILRDLLKAAHLLRPQEKSHQILPPLLGCLLTWSAGSTGIKTFCCQSKKTYHPAC